MNAITLVDWSRVTARIVGKCHSTDSGKCWDWSACTDGDGYARISFRNKNMRACKVAWMASNKSEWPDGKHALHSCDNPRCVNPEHIRPGTNAENSQEAWDRGARKKNRLRFRSHCLRGHQFTPETRAIYFRRGREDVRCRVCSREEAKIYNARRAAKKKGLVA